MQEQILELSVGDVVQIGGNLVTVVDIDGQEVRFHIHLADDFEIPAAGNRFAVATLPR